MVSIMSLPRVSLAIFWHSSTKASTRWSTFISSKHVLSCAHETVRRLLAYGVLLESSCCRAVNGQLQKEGREREREMTEEREEHSDEGVVRPHVCWHGMLAVLKTALSGDQYTMYPCIRLQQSRDRLLLEPQQPAACWVPCRKVCTRGRPAALEP